LYEIFLLIFLDSWSSSINFVFRREHKVSENVSDSFLRNNRIREDLLSWVREAELVSVTGHILSEDEADPVSENFGFRR
jgi:hypothetical protein